MGSQIRDSTLAEKGLAMLFADKVDGDSEKGLAKFAEQRWGLKVIFIKGNLRELPVLMPSGKVLVLDLYETGIQMDASFNQILTKSGYSGDLTPNGELANAIIYARTVSDAYLNMQHSTK